LLYHFPASLRYVFFLAKILADICQPLKNDEKPKQVEFKNQQALK
jgi:hypothetical protein